MRLLAKLIGLVVVALVGGFFVFAAMMPRAQSFDAQQASEKFDPLSPDNIGIVVLTGGGGARIERGFELFHEVRADRMLISGTHPDVRKADLAQRFDPDLLDCCVDLGARAQTTIGNAMEARDWAKSNGYDGIYLVSHYYHLPRAKVELRSLAPDLIIVGVPVETTTTKDAWYKSADSWVILMKEYTKYLLTVLRTVV